MKEAVTVTIGERLGWLVRSARRWLLALVALAIAMLVSAAAWTFGLFDSSTANPHNVASAGSMTQVNSSDDVAFMSATDMVPGSAVQGSVTIGNEGDASGDFTLTVEDLADDPGPNGGRLSTRLRLRVVDRGRTTAVYNGPLAGLDVSLGTWAPDEHRTYEFEVRLPDGVSRVDNGYQESSVTATFVWHAVQSR